MASIDDLVNDLASKRTHATEAQAALAQAYNTWHETFKAAAGKAVYAQAKEVITAQADHTLELQANGKLDVMREAVRQLAGTAPEDVGRKATYDEFTRAQRRDGRRGDDPADRRREILEPLQEQIGELVTEAGYEWRGWSVPGKSMAWSGPQLEDGEPEAFRTMTATLDAKGRADSVLDSATTALKRQQALDAWEA